MRLFLANHNIWCYFKACHQHMVVVHHFGGVPAIVIYLIILVKLVEINAYSSKDCGIY